MAIYALSDLHLSLAQDKPMDIYGEHWQEHHLVIQRNWLQTVREEDTVLIGGDISWAMTLKDAMCDLDFIHKLSGRKILIRGNHDYWWKSVTKLNELYDDMVFLQNTYVKESGYSICGTRGWICDGTTEQDKKMYRREQVRLELSLQAAMAHGAERIIVLLHYPPMNEKKEASDLTKLIHQYPVEKVIYGHLHGEHHSFAQNGMFDSVEYRLTSSDFLHFSPLRIDSMEF